MRRNRGSNRNRRLYGLAGGAGVNEEDVGIQALDCGGSELAGSKATTNMLLREEYAKMIRDR